VSIQRVLRFDHRRVLFGCWRLRVQCETAVRLSESEEVVVMDTQQSVDFNRNGCSAIFNRNPNTNKSSRRLTATVSRESTCHCGFVGASCELGWGSWRPTGSSISRDLDVCVCARVRVCMCVCARYTRAQGCLRASARTCVLACACARGCWRVCACLPLPVWLIPEVGLPHWLGHPCSNARGTHNSEVHHGRCSCKRSACKGKCACACCVAGKRVRGIESARGGARK